MEKKNEVRLETKQVVIGFIILLILVGIYFYYKGKDQVTISKLPPNDNLTNPSGNSSGVGQSVLTQLATNLYNDMSGISWLSNHDESLFEQALALSNYDFTQLYNIYNTKYEKDNGKTLMQMVQSCVAIPYTAFETAKNGMINRFGSLNLL